MNRGNGMDYHFLLLQAILFAKMIITSNSKEGEERCCINCSKRQEQGVKIKCINLDYTHTVCSENNCNQFLQNLEHLSSLL